MRKMRIMAAIVLMLTISCKNRNEEWTSPTVSSITESVFASGHIEAVGQFALAALNDGYIKKVTVSEGDTVKAGQTLFFQDNATSAIQQQTAAENLRIVKEEAAVNSAVFRQLEEQLNMANEKLNNDKIQLERMQRLYTTNSVARVEVEAAQLSYNNAVSNVNVLKQKIEATSLDLQQAVVNSHGQQLSAAVNTSYYNIKAPGEYKVYALLRKEGEWVRKGETVAVLGDAQKLKIVLSVDETSIEKIRLGQKVLVELNTGKGVAHIAHVSKKYPAFDAASQAYTVEALFEKNSPSLINGTLLQAYIIVARKDNALLIPRKCLGPDGSVVVKASRGRDTVMIKTGIVSNEWVEVLSALNQSTRILKQ
ncbi:HlyD family efflux transporter periplasmic adaptor subunit [Chitinophaga varians]|uniref:HlyD family efflux transporter periplasmic adaptor subunit n=1 Tax=Chitinophaga varians TaxID=2202339 RepID=A0A847RWZ2_9BACT|nr:HlyD family efflux transporter periplasmic adaptor subunit [Chitinophaga varians]NLR65555.1 HlyD family efflux transporter periplasmic adaptor subunit [Chitinophaga varians]